MIGIFDSGSGGLSVLKTIRARAPFADIVYFGDVKNVPYGNRSREELDELTAKGIQVLIKNGAEQIVSACNSVALSTKCSGVASLVSSVDCIEMVGPTVEQFRNKNARVLVLATKATIESGMYQDEFGLLGVKADGAVVPNLVNCIEGQGDRREMEDMIRDVFSHALRKEHTHVVLGCTHFPLVRDIFEKVLHTVAQDVVLIDPADAVAEEVVSRFDVAGKGATRILVSAKSAVFESFLQPLFPQGIPIVEVL